MKVKCIKISTAGKVGDIKDFPANRAAQLIKKGICEEVKEEKTEPKKETKSKKKDK